MVNHFSFKHFEYCFEIMLHIQVFYSQESVNALSAKFVEFCKIFKFYKNNNEIFLFYENSFSSYTTRIQEMFATNCIK